MNELLKQYFALQEQIFQHVGYVEDWRVLPLVDDREYFWELPLGEGRGGVVQFAETIEKLEDKAAGEYYENDIYTQRHLPKWVYRGEEITVVVVDTHTDGNQFLQIFDNAKEINGAGATK